jgi:hypothetical protein
MIEMTQLICQKCNVAQASRDIVPTLFRSTLFSFFSRLNFKNNFCHNIGFLDVFYCIYYRNCALTIEKIDSRCQI